MASRTKKLSRLQGIPLQRKYGPPRFLRKEKEVLKRVSGRPSAAGKNGSFEEYFPTPEGFPTSPPHDSDLSADLQAEEPTMADRDFTSLRQGLPRSTKKDPKVAVRGITAPDLKTSGYLTSTLKFSKNQSNEQSAYVSSEARSPLSPYKLGVGNQRMSPSNDISKDSKRRLSFTSVDAFKPSSSKAAPQGEEAVDSENEIVNVTGISTEEAQACAQACIGNSLLTQEAVESDVETASSDEVLPESCSVASSDEVQRQQVGTQRRELKPMPVSRGLRSQGRQVKHAACQRTPNLHDANEAVSPAKSSGRSRKLIKKVIDQLIDEGIVAAPSNARKGQVAVAAAKINLTTDVEKFAEDATTILSPKVKVVDVAKDTSSAKDAFSKSMQTDNSYLLVAGHKQKMSIRAAAGKVAPVPEELQLSDSAPSSAHHTLPGGEKASAPVAVYMQQSLKPSPLARVSPMPKPADPISLRNPDFKVPLATVLPSQSTRNVKYNGIDESADTSHLKSTSFMSDSTQSRRPRKRRGPGYSLPKKSKPHSSSAFKSAAHSTRDTSELKTVTTATAVSAAYTDADSHAQDSVGGSRYPLLSSTGESEVKARSVGRQGDVTSKKSASEVDACDFRVMSSKPSKDVSVDFMIQDDVLMNIHQDAPKSILVSAKKKDGAAVKRRVSLYVPDASELSEKAAVPPEPMKPAESEESTASGDADKVAQALKHLLVEPIADDYEPDGWVGPFGNTEPAPEAHDPSLHHVTDLETSAVPRRSGRRRLPTQPVCPYNVSLLGKSTIIAVSQLKESSSQGKCGSVKPVKKKKFASKGRSSTVMEERALPTGSKSSKPATKTKYKSKDTKPHLSPVSEECHLPVENTISSVGNQRKRKHDPPSQSPKVFKPDSRPIDLIYNETAHKDRVPLVEAAVAVKNPKTNSMDEIVLTRSAGSVSWITPGDSIGLFIHKYFSFPAFSCGQLMLAPRSTKELQRVRNDTMLFFLITGDVTVTIHQSKRDLNAGSVFIIPEGNSYSVENQSSEEARLIFVQLKG